MVLLEDALERDGEEAGLGNSEWLSGKLKRGNTLETPMAAKRQDLQARPAPADAGRVMALDLLEEGVARLVALEQELQDKAARLVGRRHWKRSRTLFL